MMPVHILPFFSRFCNCKSYFVGILFAARMKTGVMNLEVDTGEM
jgi:hypothetical protein